MKPVLYRKNKTKKKKKEAGKMPIVGFGSADRASAHMRWAARYAPNEQDKLPTRPETKDK
jgi:hypothetical protein